MDIEKIYNEIEENNQIENEKICKEALVELYNQIEDIPYYEYPEISNIEILITFLFNRMTQENQSKIIQILRKYNYRLEAEIPIIMKELCVNVKKYRHTIPRLQNMGSVQNLEYNDKDKQYILDSEFGTIKIMPAIEYFKNDKNIYNYIKLNYASSYCHSATEWLIQQYPYNTAVTSLCPNLFVGSFYHSYVVTNDEKVVDLALEAVVNLKDVEKIYHNQEINQISGKEYIKYLYDLKMIQSSLSEDYSPILIDALQQQKHEYYMKDKNIRLKSKTIY